MYAFKTKNHVSVIKIDKKPVNTRIHLLTKAVCENIFSTIENRVLRFSFIYKIEI